MDVSRREIILCSSVGMAVIAGSALVAVIPDIVMFIVHLAASMFMAINARKNTIVVLIDMAIGA